MFLDPYTSSVKMCKVFDNSFGTYIFMLKHLTSVLSFIWWSYLNVYWYSIFICFIEDSILVSPAFTWDSFFLQAFDLVEYKYVACKLHGLNAQWSEEKKQSYIRHAIREYNIHKTLVHPNIVRLWDIFEIDHNTFCTVLEYCSGTTNLFSQRPSKFLWHDNVDRAASFINISHWLHCIDKAAWVLFLCQIYIDVLQALFCVKHSISLRNCSVLLVGIFFFSRKRRRAPFHFIISRNLN